MYWEEEKTLRFRYSLLVNEINSNYTKSNTQPQIRTSETDTKHASGLIGPLYDALIFK